MKKWAILTIMVIISVLLIIVGCESKESTKEEVYEKFHKKIMDMSSYSCEAKVEAIGNKSMGEYIFKQTYKKPNTYKLEIISPEQLKGKSIEYTSENILIENKRINDIVKLPNIHPNDQYLFIGDFISNYINNEDIEINKSSENLLLKTSIPGDSEYFTKEILYVDLKTKNPTKLEIIDKEENVRFRVTYKNFEIKK